MQIFKTLFKYYLYLVGIFFIGRVALFMLYFDRFSDDTSSDYYMSFLYGLRMDTIAACMLLIVPLLLLSFSPKFLGGVVNIFLKLYFLAIFLFVIYIENATFPFFAEYDVRPNYLFVEYLEYPKEVFAMIFAEYKLALFISFMMLSLFTFFYFRFIKPEFKHIFQTKFLARVLWFLPIGILLFGGIRSSFGHRPANISDAMYSNNRIVNEITKNSPYSIGYAMYSNKKYGIKKLKYGNMPIDEAISRVKNALDIQSDDNESIFRRLEKTHFPTNKKKNLVILIEESMGYQFVEAVGGEAGITPRLNSLANESILFRNLYSNGTRSIRGIAGLVSGNFAVPGKGVLKRPKSQKDFFTISKLLKPHGYHTIFLYGGESRFDNMRGWFLGNGFDEIIDQPKFKDPKFVGTWGVSDGDLLSRANEEFVKLYIQNQPFGAVIFSTSNHTPFDFPQDDIDLVPNVKTKSVKNAVKYADEAIGQFINQAKNSGYYEDTVFVIASDHNVRVYGDDVVPVEMFQIPAMILGSGVKPLSYDRLSTQGDVLATALDLLGIDMSYPIMGNSIFKDTKKDISLMQFNTTYGLRRGNKVAVIQPDKKPKTFLYQNKHLVPTTHDNELEKDALAFVITLNHIYKNKLYK